MAELGGKIAGHTPFTLPNARPGTGRGVKREVGGGHGKRMDESRSPSGDTKINSSNGTRGPEDTARE